MSLEDEDETGSLKDRLDRDDGADHWPPEWDGPVIVSVRCRRCGSVAGVVMAAPIGLCWFARSRFMVEPGRRVEGEHVVEMDRDDGPLLAICHARKEINRADVLEAIATAKRRGTKQTIKF